jgi:hypothetical protein
MSIADTWDEKDSQTFAVPPVNYGRLPRYSVKPSFSQCFHPGLPWIAMGY